jgi:GH25 family lysozyme M1 (1,4-beta-N-acetylmuramidase)
MVGIDVSHWQGVIDWQAVAGAGITFAILKAGGSDNNFYTDSRFEEYYRAARAAGLHVGAYYFVGKRFISADDGKADAARFLRIIAGKEFDMPVYVDVEATSPSTRNGTTAATKAFCDAMEDANYFVGIYASDVAGFRDRLIDNELAGYDHWVARYNGAPTYVKGYGMWQSTSKARIAGIVPYVDMDYAYKEYPSIIRKYGFNNVKEGATK